MSLLLLGSSSCGRRGWDGWDSSWLRCWVSRVVRGWRPRSRGCCGRRRGRVRSCVLAALLLWCCLGRRSGSLGRVDGAVSVYGNRRHCRLGQGRSGKCSVTGLFGCACLPAAVLVACCPEHASLLATRGPVAVCGAHAALFIMRTRTVDQEQDREGRGSQCL